MSRAIELYDRYDEDFRDPETVAALAQLDATLKLVRMVGAVADELERIRWEMEADDA